MVLLSALSTCIKNKKKKKKKKVQNNQPTKQKNPVYEHLDFKD